MSHYLVKPLYYYSVQGPTMKSNSAPSPSPAQCCSQRCVQGHSSTLYGGGGAKFRKSFKSLQINFQDCSSSCINTTVVASSTLQLVASTFASSAPALSPHLAASSVVSSPIFPPRMVSPSLVPTAAVPVVLPAVPSSGSSTSMFNPQSFPPQQALGPSIAPTVAPPCTLQSMPQLPLFAQAQVPQLATVPAAQGIHTLSRYAIFVCFFLAVPVSGAGVAVPGVRFPGHAVVAPGSSLCIYVLPCNFCINLFVSICCITFC